MAINNVKYLSCQTSQVIGVLTHIHELTHDPLHQSSSPLHANWPRQVDKSPWLMSDIETEEWPQTATKETELSSRHYFGPDANSYFGLLPFSHFYKNLSCLRNIGLSRGQRDGRTLYHVSLKRKLLIPRSSPPAAPCNTPSVLSQCCNWNHLIYFSLTLH